MKTVVLILTLFISVSGMAGSNCISPAPDSYKTARKPELKGKIVGITDSNSLSIESSSGRKFEVQINFNSPSLFTQFGGMIFFKELKKGDRVEVWTVDCEAIGKSTSVNADKVLVYK